MKRLAFAVGAAIIALVLAGPGADAQNTVTTNTAITGQGTSSSLPNGTTVTVGTGGTTGRLCAVLDSQAPDVGTDANTTEKALYTYTLTANTLATDYRYIEIEAKGTLGANANTKNVRVYWGPMATGTLIAGDNTTENNGNWRMFGQVMRTAAAAQRTYGWGMRTAAFNFDGGRYNTATRDLTASNTIIVAGQNGTASANDVVLRIVTLRLC